jgi:5'(3')-deoxyribonucleotidase
MKHKTILLDMDGVLADFHQGVCDLYNVNLAQCTIPAPWEYAIEKNISSLLDRTISASEMWNEINRCTEERAFWLNLRPYPWLAPLFKELQGLSYVGRTWEADNAQIPVDIVISSSPGFHPLAHSQKVEWLYRHTPIKKGNVMLGKHKHLMANGSTFLIDDCDENISAFHRNGGACFLWPQKWNSRAYMAGNLDLTFKMLRDQLAVFLTK